jgi:indolepyruvate ferredoxin oxidoreductase
VLNTEETPTGTFTRVVDFRIPGKDILGDLQTACADALPLPATALARDRLGDAIYANMVALGAAWQAGMLPLSRAAVEQAIRLNGQAVEGNLAAFALGRAAVAGLLPAAETAVEPDPVAFRADHLRVYQDDALADRFLRFVAQIPDPVRESVAKGYHKVLAIKDEYEVARLHVTTLDKARESLAGALKPTFHLAPPLLPGRDARGRPKKRAFGPWVIPLFRLLSRMKRLRGTWADPFGRTAERRMERALIATYEADMAEVLPLCTPHTEALIRELAELPLTIRGFGPVKALAAQKAETRRQALLAAIRAAVVPRIAAE